MQRKGDFHPHLFPFWGKIWQYSSFFSLIVLIWFFCIHPLWSLCVFCSVGDDWGVSPLLGAVHICLPQAPVDMPPAPLSSLPSSKMLFRWVFPPTLQISVSPGLPDFQTPLNLTLQQNYLPALDCWPLSFLFLPFTHEPPVSVWCWAGNAEGFVLLWVLTDVDIAFHQLFWWKLSPMALSAMEQTPARCSHAIWWILWATSETNLCRWHLCCHPEELWWLCHPPWGTGNEELGSGSSCGW